MSTRRPRPKPNLPSGPEAIVVPGLPGAGTPAVPAPDPYPGIQGYGQVNKPAKRRGGTRPDAPGMSRESYYITAAAAAAVAAAVDRITAALGDDDLPKHVPLSAVLLAGAERADEIAAQLAADQAAALKQRLAALEKPAR